VESGLSYAAGLLRNLGTVVIDACSNGKVYPGEAEWPLISDWEKQTFGMSSAEVTTTLLEHWRFPTGVIDAIRAQHDPLADDISNVGACVLNLACGVSRRFGLDLPGEAKHWERSEAKLALGGVTDLVLEQCADNAHAHYLALCATLS
jgi:HD-like signal output (HDOD) protein